jgi:biotin carboxylase
MKQDAILFIDIDDCASVRYRYREPHFAVARTRGLVCLTAAVSGRKQLERLQGNSYEVYMLDTLSEQSILNLINTLDVQYNVRAIFCHAGHASAQGQVGCIVARVCKQLGLVYTCPDAIAVSNNKYLMRKVLQKNALRSVLHALCSNEQELEEGACHVGYPLIAKPPFGGGSAFIKKCSNWKELHSHYEHFLLCHGAAAHSDFYGDAQTLPDDGGPLRTYIPGQSILLEGYISGTEGSVECVIVGDRIHPVLINEKLLLTQRRGTILENLLVTPPASFSEEQCDQVRQYAVNCLQAIGLTNAIVHFEFRMTEDGPVAIEVNPRLGGLYVDAAFRDLACINPYQLYISLLLGEQEINAQLVASTQKAAGSGQSYAMLAIYPEKNGYFKGFEGLSYLDDNEWVLEYAEQDAGSYIDADVEEHYLLKCWARVNDAAHAHALHDGIRQNLRAIIDNPVAG